MNKEILPMSLTRDETTSLYSSLVKSIHELKGKATKKELQELDQLKKRLQDNLTIEIISIHKNCMNWEGKPESGT